MVWNFYFIRCASLHCIRLQSYPLGLSSRYWIKCIQLLSVHVHMPVTWCKDGQSPPFFAPVGETDSRRTSFSSTGKLGCSCWLPSHDPDTANVATDLRCPLAATLRCVLSTCDVTLSNGIH